MNDLRSFDGLDNRREIMLLLERLGTDAHRARFIKSIIPHSVNGFANNPVAVEGPCDPVAAYFMLVGVCNELGVPINVAARKLEAVIKKNWYGQTK